MLTYNINIIIRIQTHRDAPIQVQVYEKVSILGKGWPGVFLSKANTNIPISPTLRHFEICKVYYLVNSLSVIQKNERGRWAGHVAGTGERRGV